ncbi:MAG TPA: hypothetical protein VFH71_08740 [Rhodanobacteraceae bacterium]|nr:hypothetical protein [Rhodanobacteraceae bacterium]
MQTFHNRRREPDALSLAAATWLAAGAVLFGLTPLPLHDPHYGWSLAFWLLAAPGAILLARSVVRAHHPLAPLRLRSIRRRNSCMMRR